MLPELFALEDIIDQELEAAFVFQDFLLDARGNHVIALVAGDAIDGTSIVKSIQLACITLAKSKGVLGIEAKARRTGAEATFGGIEPPSLVCAFILIAEHIGKVAAGPPAEERSSGGKADAVIDFSAQVLRTFEGCVQFVDLPVHPGDHIGGAVVADGRGVTAFKTMAQLESMNEFGSEEGIALVEEQGVAEYAEGVEVAIIRALYPAAVGGL